MVNNATITFKPVNGDYYVRLEEDVSGLDAHQGKVGIVRAIRTDGILEIDFSCSGGISLACIDSRLLGEC